MNEEEAQEHGWDRVSDEERYPEPSDLDGVEASDDGDGAVRFRGTLAARPGEIYDSETGWGPIPNYVPRRIRELVEFAARMDRSMEEAVLMEGDDEWLASLDGPQLGDALSEAERMIRAGRTIKKIVEAHLEMDIREHGAIRLGDSGYYVGSATKRKVIDSAGLLNFLHSLGGVNAIDKAVRVDASNVRISNVRAVAESVHEDAGAVIDSFFEETVEEEILRKVPESRSKWVQGLESGERR